MNMNTQAYPAIAHIFRTALYLVWMIAWGSVPLHADESDRGKKDSELSVAPLTHTVYAESRPSWIDQAPTREDEDDLLPVSSVPCRDEKLCDEALQVAMRAATETYAESLTAMTKPRVG